MTGIPEEDPMDDTVPDPRDSEASDPCLAAAVRRSTRVVAVQPWLVASLGAGPAVWFSQLLWRMEVEGSDTIVAPDHSWEDDTGLSRSQALRARQKVEGLGWITSEVRKVAGTPQCRVTLQPRALEADYRALHCPPLNSPGSRDDGQSSSLQTGVDSPPTEDVPDCATEGLFGADPAPTPPPSAADLGAGFVRFWAAYPRKTGKGAARTAFAQAVKKATVDQICEAAAAFARVRADEDPRYTPHPTTWLNQERWSDELPARARRQEAGPGAVIGRSGDQGAEVLTKGDLFGGR